MDPEQAQRIRSNKCAGGFDFQYYYESTLSAWAYHAQSQGNYEDNV